MLFIMSFELKLKLRLIRFPIKLLLKYFNRVDESTNLILVFVNEVNVKINSRQISGVTIEFFNILSFLSKLSP